MNYTKIRVTLKDNTELYIDEDELIVFKLSGEYKYIEYLNDKDEWHRLDGPAFEGASGSKEWWVGGKHHRLDGPAVEWADGSKEWWVDGKRHRLDGPAIEWADGSKVWCVDGKEYSQKKFEKIQRIHRKSLKRYRGSNELH
jgi:hypothetical protein